MKKFKYLLNNRKKFKCFKRVHLFFFYHYVSIYLLFMCVYIYKFSSPYIGPYISIRKTTCFDPRVICEIFPQGSNIWFKLVIDQQNQPSNSVTTLVVVTKRTIFHTSTCEMASYYSTPSLSIR